MPDYVTDTHGLVWYLEDDGRLGEMARKAFEQCDSGNVQIYIPSICLVELVFLQERGRIAANLLARLLAVLDAGTTELLVAPLTIEVVR